MDGKHSGHCGSDRFGNLKKCLNDDVMCGMLQCSSVNGQVVSKKSHKSKWYAGIGGSGSLCWGIQYENANESLVTNGAKCGKNKVCSNQKCISVIDLKINCPDCHGNGICNSKGNCHCNDGWAPPFCNSPGDGGSVDSQKEENGSSEFKLKFEILSI